MTLGSRGGGNVIGIPHIWSICFHDPGYIVIGYMVIPDTWSILAGPDVDDVSGTQCNPVHLYLDAADGHESTTKRVCEQKRRFLILAAALSNELDILLKSTQITLLLFLVQ